MSLPSLLSNARSSLQKNFGQPISDMFWTRIDSTNVHDMVRQQGYDHELIEVETEDGYVIQMDRIINKMSFNVAYF